MSEDMEKAHRAAILVTFVAGVSLVLLAIHLMSVGVSGR